MMSLLKKMIRAYFKNRNRLKDIENKLWLIKGKEERDKLEVWD